MKSIIPAVTIERRIYLIRGHKVMLDSDLAELYDVTTGNLNKAVTRNIDRFPADFMFRLSREEYNSLRFQFGILKRGGHSKYPPHVFTEQGVSMLSSVLKSKRAIHVNIAIMRAFVKLRETLTLHKELAGKLGLLENKIAKHDEEIQSIFEAIRQLISHPPEKPKKQIGFTAKEKRMRYYAKK